MKNHDAPRTDSAHEARSPFGSGRRDDRDDTRAFLSLATIRGIGQQTLYTIAESGRSFCDALENGPDDSPLSTHAEKTPASPGHWSTLRKYAVDNGDQLAEQLDRMGIVVLLRGMPGFPLSLMELERPPHWLFVQGSISRLSETSIAIVGTRKPSPDGVFLARYLGACLGDWGVPTVSGLATGIDQLAHEHSLNANVPTIAILGTGMLQDYPKGSNLMRERILATGGCIVSEYLPHTSYSAENFVQRNRLQAALGRILIPAEWNRRSGTAHTVRFATTLGRPIACLRLPEWPADRVVLEVGLGLPGGAVFTVPRQQGRLDSFVRAALVEGPSTHEGQLSLFDKV